MEDYFKELNAVNEAVKSLGKAIIEDYEKPLIENKAPVAEVPCSAGLDTIADLRELLRDIKKWDIDRSGEHFMKTGQAMQMLLPECLRKRIQKAVMSD